jgi:hypothetical protein
MGTAFFDTPCVADDPADFVSVPPLNTDACVFFPVTRDDQTPTRPRLALNSACSRGVTLTASVPVTTGPGSATYTVLSVDRPGCYQVTISVSTTTLLTGAANFVFALTLCAVVGGTLIRVPAFPTTLLVQDDIQDSGSATITGIVCLAPEQQLLPCIEIQPISSITAAADEILIPQVSMTVVRLSGCL